MDPAQTALDDLRQVNADACRLAGFASLVLRVEPALLRVLRRYLMHHADPSAEIDLWFSRLVRVRSSSAIGFDPSVLQVLRAQLAAEPQRHEAADLTRRHLAHAHPYARSELELTALPLLDATLSDTAIEAHLAPLLDDLRAGGDAAMNAARWLLQAAPRWHPRVRATGAAWAALQAASALLGGRVLSPGAAPEHVDPAALASLGLRLPLRDIGVVMSPHRLDFVPTGTPGAATVRVPQPWPSLTLLEEASQPARVISAAEGTSVELQSVGALTLRNLDGSGWRVRSKPRRAVAPRKGGRARLRARFGEGTVHIGEGTVHVEVFIDGSAQPVSHGHMPATILIQPPSVGDEPSHLWPPAQDESFWPALEPLRHAQVIQLELDGWTASMPWEALQLPGRGGGWAERALGLRMLRNAAPARTPAEPRLSVGGNHALLLADWAGEHLPKVSMREGDVLSRLLEEFSALVVTRAEPVVPELVEGLLRDTPLALLHWSSRIVETMSAEPITSSMSNVPNDPPLPGMFAHDHLTVAGLKLLPAAPELVFLNFDYSGHTLERHSPLPSSARDGPAHPADTLLSMGVPMLVAIGGKPTFDPEAVFARRFHETLLRGGTLLEAAVAARTALRQAHPKSDDWTLYQVHGDPDHKASYALGEAEAALLRSTAARSLVELTGLGKDPVPMAGLRVGPGLVLMARLAVGQIPVLGARHGSIAERYAIDPPDDDNPVAVGLQVDGATAADGRPQLPIALAQSARRRRAHVFAMRDGRIHAFELNCERESGASEGWARYERWVLSLTRRGRKLPDELRGAPLVANDHCVGLVVDQRDDGTWLACGTDALRAALASSQRRYVAQRLQAHAEWLDSHEHRGRRLVADGADLRGYDLRGARLSRASLVGALLQRADLREARLDGADLRKADLREAELEGASLEGALMQEADLTRARLGRGAKGARVPGNTPARPKVAVLGKTPSGKVLSSLRSLLPMAAIELIADRDVVPFEADVLPQLFDACDAGVILWDAPAAHSEWVGVEIRHALDRGLPLLVILLDNTPLPQFLMHLQFIRPSSPAALYEDKTLIEAVHRLLQAPRGQRAS